MIALEADLIRGRLSGRLPKMPRLNILDSIDSTNAEALRCVGTAESGSVWIAEQQTAGRGRRGKQWISPEASNLYFSMLWKFSGDQSQLGGLSLAVGVVLGRVLGAHGVNGVELKWPNDVLIARQKLAGILIEMQIDTANQVWLVIGIGLNSDMAQESEAKIGHPWTDLAAQLENVPDRNILVADLIAELSKSVESFQSEGFAPFELEWQQYDALEGRSVNVLAGDEVQNGIAAGVASDGALKLQTTQSLVSVYGGEVSVRLAEGEK